MARNGCATRRSRSTSHSSAAPPADPDGNVTMEREALTLDNLAAAMAAKNSRGLRHRPGRAHRSRGLAQSARGADARHSGRLRRGRRSQNSPADLRHPLQSCLLRPAARAARPHRADGARRAQDHRAALRLRAAARAALSISASACRRAWPPLRRRSECSNT